MNAVHSALGYYDLHCLFLLYNKLKIILFSAEVGSLSLICMETTIIRNRSIRSSAIKQPLPVMTTKDQSIEAPMVFVTISKIQHGAWLYMSMRGIYRLSMMTVYI